MSFRKTLVTISLTALFLTSNANAGILFVAAGVGHWKVNRGESLASIIVGVIAGGLSAVTVGLPLLVMNADGSLNTNEMAEKLSNKFPFIDSAETVNDLATVVNAKYESQKNADGSANISLSTQEVLKIVEDSGLTDAQVDQIVKELGK